MDKRMKKRLDAQRTKLQKLELQLQVAGENQQPENESEIARLQNEVTVIKEQMLRTIGG